MGGGGRGGNAVIVYSASDEDGGHFSAVFCAVAFGAFWGSEYLDPLEEFAAIAQNRPTWWGFEFLERRVRSVGADAPAWATTLALPGCEGRFSDTDERNLMLVAWLVRICTYVRT